MRREQLDMYCEPRTIAQADAALVIGSQAILGAFTEEVLPEAAVGSVEVDVTFFGSQQAGCLADTPRA